MHKDNDFKNGGFVNRAECLDCLSNTYQISYDLLEFLYDLMTESELEAFANSYTNQ